MSFREKSAWITLVTVLVCFGVYFGSVATGAVSPRSFQMLHLLVACVGGLAVLQVVLHVAAARLTPASERAVRDEREARIQSRSHTVGYYVLVACVLGLFVPGHMGYGPIELMNFALLDVVVAALAVSASQIVLFRLGG